MNLKFYNTLPPLIAYYVPGKVEILYLPLSYVLWEQQNCPELYKNQNFDKAYYFVRCVFVLEISGTPVNYA